MRNVKSGALLRTATAKHVVQQRLRHGPEDQGGKEDDSEGHAYDGGTVAVYAAAVVVVIEVY